MRGDNLKKLEDNGRHLFFRRQQLLAAGLL